MNIASLQYNLNGVLEIYVSGCDGYCKGCHNEELWDFKIGRDYKEVLDEIHNLLKGYRDPRLLQIKQVWIMGGEPLLQNREELYDLLDHVGHYDGLELAIFTRFEELDLDPELLSRCDFIKCGPYIEGDGYKLDGEIILRSKNQYILRKGINY